MGLRARSGNRRGASTLIELLVVIFVLGVLMSLLLPSLKRSMDLASATMCRSNLREIGRSLSVYRFESEGWLPMNDPEQPQAELRNENGPWFAKLFPTYMPDPLVLRCPKDPFGFRLQQARDKIRDPEVADFASYGINDFLMRAGGGYLANVDRHPPKRPHDTILAADLGPDSERGGPNRSSLRMGPSRNGSLLMWSDGYDPLTDRQSDTWVTSRHVHGINMLTLEGGIREVRTTDTLRSPIQRYYSYCAAAGCTLCNELGLQHYSFAKDRLFWYTGRIPTE